MMTHNEFLSALKTRGVQTAPPITTAQISYTNTALQRLRAAMLPMYMIELYGAIGGARLGSGYIFGPNDITFDTTYPIPNIVKINEEISSMPAITGKTVFGRNDLFWFAFDAFGTCYMLDNLSLRHLRKYDDPYRAMLDCLNGGKI
ncbi:MAG: hypothetical protein NC311_03260 [Muribaculaceae bacterium]|nr:hypothetical protein [Muribaculaceae bacterium]